MTVFNIFYFKNVIQSKTIQENSHITMGQNYEREKLGHHTGHSLLRIIFTHSMHSSWFSSFIIQQSTNLMIKWKKERDLAQLGGYMY